MTQGVLGLQHCDRVFMIVDRPREFEDLLRDASIEASGIVTRLMVAAFNRRRPFETIERAAKAIGIQVRRLVRVTSQFAELFAFAEGLIEGALRRYLCPAEERQMQEKRQENENFRANSPMNSTPAVQKEESEKVEDSRRPEPEARYARRSKIRKSPETKAHVKRLLVSKHWRYLHARGRPGEAEAYVEAVDSATGFPPQAIFDAVDRRMRAERWNDHEEAAA